MNVEFEDNNQEIRVDEGEFNIELATNNINVELGASSVYIPFATDHSILDNLEYDNSGHTGFQREMSALTNIEIERMWSNI